MFAILSLRARTGAVTKPRMVATPRARRNDFFGNTFSA
jgi:hypothetical protein